MNEEELNKLMACRSAMAERTTQLMHEQKLDRHTAFQIAFKEIQPIFYPKKEEQNQQPSSSSSPEQT